MEWGHAIIDPLGYGEFCIEGSPIGRWLYEGYGYRRVMGLHVDFDKPNPSDEWLRLVHECKPPVFCFFGGHLEGNGRRRFLLVLGQSLSRLSSSIFMNST